MNAQSTPWRLWVSAGTGPIEVQRFAVLLARELERLCLDAGATLLDTDPAEPVDAARSLSATLQGDRRALAGLLGTHALLFDARRDRDGRHRGHRKRWFVHVWVDASPLAENDSPTVDPRDVHMHCSRAGGPGGQHVNTTATAVRAIHRPTGVAVRVSDSRSQSHNRSVALERITAALQRQAAGEQRSAERAAQQACRVVVRGDPVAVWRLDPRDGLVRA